MKLFQRQEESEAVHEWHVLVKLRSHARHFVQLFGWTYLNGCIALITRTVAISCRHYLPSSMVELLRYSVSLCDVCANLSPSEWLVAE